MHVVLFTVTYFDLPLELVCFSYCFTHILAPTVLTKEKKRVKH